MVNFGKGYSNEEVEEVVENQAPPEVIGNEANEDRGTVETRDKSAQEVTEALMGRFSGSLSSTRTRFVSLAHYFPTGTG
jgi:hypothetical protein